MKTFGIICECNPFHGGHQYLIEQARESGADAIVCVMSGSFVQRGEAAILSPHARAEILVRSGADAVVELPFPYAAASAEFFGRAGVEILERLGADEVWFGSETGDLSILSRYAEVAESAEFQAAYANAAEGEGGTASSYFALLAKMANDENAACAPNDILAISYLRAIRAMGAKIRPVSVKRQGSGYNEAVLANDRFPSATALRRAWSENGFDTAAAQLPIACAEVAAGETAEGRAPATLQNAQALVLGMLALTPQKELEGYAGLGGGLAGRIHEAAQKAHTLEELWALCATKKYPDARIRRGVLAALLRVTDADLRAPVAYVRLLAANGEGRAFLAGVRKSGSLPVITRQTDLPTSSLAARQFALEEAAATLYGKCLPQAAVAEEQLCRPPVILGAKK